MLSGETVERRARGSSWTRVHTPDYLDLLASIKRPTLLDADTVAYATSGRRRSSRRGSRSRRSTAAASRSSVRPATTRSPTGRWASAS